MQKEAIRRNRQMSTDLGEFLGYTIITLYGLTVLNYFVKLANRKLRAIINKNKAVAKVFSLLMKFIVKNHKLFGLLTIVVLLSHATNQFLIYGISLTGALAASLLILQVALGIYGYKAKKRGKTWLRIHRSVAVLLLIAIGTHAL